MKLGMTMSLGDTPAGKAGGNSGAVIWTPPPKWILEESGNVVTGESGETISRE